MLGSEAFDANVIYKYIVFKIRTEHLLRRRGIQTFFPTNRKLQRIRQKQRNILKHLQLQILPKHEHPRQFLSFKAM